MSKSLISKYYYLVIMTMFRLWISDQNVDISSVKNLSSVEDNGFKPLTPCVQSRCSISWANPPLFTFENEEFENLEVKTAVNEFSN